ncbi:hypothetical protein ABZ912_46390 [Nonomuraea angiospora]|uniref:hypothetical protein n=1 Tax=Nonomuraea angiospora TaxID=46172 RepID=UPI0033C6C08A
MSTVIQASTEIDLEDAGVARKQPRDSKAKEPDRELWPGWSTRPASRAWNWWARTGCSAG